MPKVTKKCEQCGEEFCKRITNGIPRFCSKNCYTNSRRVEYECSYCSKKFIKFKSYVTQNKLGIKHKVYCSRKCQNLGKRNRIKFICKGCKQEVISKHPASLHIKSNIQFCSRKCYAESLRRKDKFNNGTKKIAIKVCGFSCQKCGTKEGPIHTHHIDGNNKNNPTDGSNWVRLCTKCHAWAHKTARTITRYLTREEILGTVPIGKRLKKVKENPKQMSLF